MEEDKSFHAHESQTSCEISPSADLHDYTFYLLFYGCLKCRAYSTVTYRRDVTAFLLRHEVEGVGGAERGGGEIKASVEGGDRQTRMDRRLPLPPASRSLTWRRQVLSQFPLNPTWPPPPASLLTQPSDHGKEDITPFRLSACKTEGAAAKYYVC